MTPTGIGGPARRNNWQDRGNLVLAIWLFLSPWVLHFDAGAPGEPATGAGAAAWNAWVLGVVVGLVSASAIGRMEFWQERLNVVLAIWIFVAPWVLGFALLPRSSWNHWIVGVLVLGFSLSMLRHRGPRPPGRQAE